ncbi:TraM recognition domain-containing protein [Microaerobacter geothermalis]|uniref:type IV secretory system conjugative DNA transfer family protein n=1 Tax=Microaerobacter geothermalis TaxID=674972 RepID=UPI001F422D0B|nr:TraM recognition domain-containing protein [Microaerobacter geothermalis]MCF6094524.1 TraM recognition domain-containing protein [Microaerobacter geothermalis]
MPLLQWGGRDAFTHMLVAGPSRCGKTATVLKPIIYQILLQKRAGKKVGLSLIEPKGDVAFMVREMCEAMEIDYIHVDPAVNRSYADESGYSAYRSHVFNPMQGDTEMVAEATVAVLKSLFGKQEAFFATVQELSSRNVTKLLKELQGDRLDLMEVLQTLRDPVILEKKVKELKQRDGETDLVQFFEAELLGTLKDKYRQFVIGLRAQLENLTSNQNLKRVITGNSSINIDRHLEKGGVLAVNTALGELGTSGDAFGQFVAMHLQSGTFRRRGTERTRVPHFMIEDEYSRYINPDIERFLTMAAEYKVAGIFAIQSLGQLEVESGKISAKAMKQTIITSCQNLIAFGGYKGSEAKEIADLFGKEPVIERDNIYEGSLIPHIIPKTYKDVEKERYRIHPAMLMNGMPEFHFVHQLRCNGVLQKPGIARGNFVPRDWKDRLVNDKRKIFDLKVVIKPVTHIKTKLQKKKAEKIFAVNPFEETAVDDGVQQSVSYPQNTIETVDNVNTSLPFKLIVSKPEVLSEKRGSHQVNSKERLSDDFWN